MCAQEHARMTAHMWKSEDNILESVCLFHHEGSGIRVGSKLSCLRGRLTGSFSALCGWKTTAAKIFQWLPDSDSSLKGPGRG